MGTLSQITGPAWVLSEAAVRALPEDAIAAINAVGLDPSAHPLPDLLNTLHAAKTSALQTEVMRSVSAIRAR